MKPTNFALHLTAFLTDYLPARRGVSPNTIKTYRDAFVLLLRYLRDDKGWPAERLRLEQIDDAVVLQFLAFLETKRQSCVRTRNHRLTALRSFFRYVQTEVPECILQCQRILSIPVQRCGQMPVRYFSPETLAKVLSQPDLKSRMGRRHAMLLSLLYDSGARVQELIGLKPVDLRLDCPAYVELSGKGNKTRIVPLMSNTVQLLKNYIAEWDLDRPQHREQPLFTNRFGLKLSRSGIRYILLKYTGQAEVATNKVSPHTMRHTKAMHLLMADTPLPIIRDFLGHEDISTTGVYARASIEMKRQALERADQHSPKLSLPEEYWKQDRDLLGWLKSL